MTMKRMKMERVMMMMLRKCTLSNRGHKKGEMTRKDQPHNLKVSLFLIESNIGDDENSVTNKEANNMVVRLNLLKVLSMLFGIISLTICRKYPINFISPSFMDLLQ